ncbi:MAG TPA: M13 family metallopeptidase [Steroidobacteraceae bacterium]|nr:M13 family metallopeptidase [Steroidobacteraceae bacterium]
MTTRRASIAAAGYAAALLLAMHASGARAQAPSGARLSSPGSADRPYTSLPYSPSLDVSAMDRSVDPCQDLYTYACGGWEQANPIPPDQTSWSVYGKLTVDVRRYLWGILEELSRPVALRTPDQQRIGDYFAACMNVAAIEQAGIAPLRGDLARIEALSDKRQLAGLVADLQARSGSDGFYFASGVEQDARDATKVIAGIGSGGLGLPDRDYYLKQDSRSQAIRARYAAHVARLLELTGEPAIAARSDAAVVLRIETALARASLSMVDKRDPYKVYHRTTIESLRQMAPAFDWSAYFEASGLGARPWLDDSEPQFVRELNARIESEPLADLKTYLRWALVNATARYLSSAFVTESFDFQGAYLLGAKTDRPRWQKCVGWIDRDLGEALGREFVARNFSPATQRRVERMTQQIEVAMKTRIEKLDWMSPATKAQALVKLALVRNKLGYPRHWRDYSTLIIRRDDFLGNVERAASFEWHREASKIGRPVDRDEWQITPATVDAYYDDQLNDINFPAGVLIPPLFDAKEDDAPNYGNTGGTIGHELTHAFDDQGRQYDGHGNLRNWWTAADAKQFGERARCITDQYAQYTVVDHLKINSALTEGEDIADLGGELLAWMAWQAERRGVALRNRDGLTPEQRFFVGFAQWACANERPERLRADAIVDPHSPPRDRINGVVVNMPEFARAFHCRAGAPLVKPADKVCKIW